ncbi:hypothetical protein CY34DRAFT_12429 [Suillus luteus UH-Slu-Lm8-n1]|uniref:DUF6533 domain-containing protein n=1 Tax=Suillus luteus UH-Slu-Lm8-n1 TaxID=930992 RepID=A0A0D0BGL4_9AGAM|nr:hypothetical protein CY34DRAFT_12429 [Suillus luteus UH-Slu-Lm8-n1]
MAAVSNDPSWWPFINANIVVSYWIAATAFVVVYDWVLTLGQEIELIWYYGFGNYAIDLADRCRVSEIPTIDLVRHNDYTGNILYYATNGTNVVIVVMLGVIMIARLHAMYQGSRTMLIFLVIIFLCINIACGVLTAIGLKYVVVEKLLLSGMYICDYGFERDDQLLFSMTWTLSTVWEVLALCLSVWIAVKYFRDLRRLGPSTGSTFGDCFRVLIKSHVLYFASFAAVSCLQLTYLSPVLSNSNYVGPLILYGAVNIVLDVQMFVLGPRLILSIREYHAKLVADSDAETSMNSIVFQEHVRILTTSSTV